jgi:hypothetical protein
MAVAWLLLLLPSGLTVPFCLCTADCVHVESRCCSDATHGQRPGEERKQASRGCCEKSCVLELNETDPQSQPPHVVRVAGTPPFVALRWQVATAPRAKFDALSRAKRAPRPPPLVERSTVLLI